LLWILVLAGFQFFFLWAVAGLWGMVLSRFLQEVLVWILRLCTKVAIFRWFQGMLVCSCSILVDLTGVPG
jgi:hypothetical protein